jgi:hypothetical protein
MQSIGECNLMIVDRLSETGTAWHDERALATTNCEENRSDAGVTNDHACRAHEPGEHRIRKEVNTSCTRRPERR